MTVTALQAAWLIPLYPLLAGAFCCGAWRRSTLNGT